MTSRCDACQHWHALTEAAQAEDDPDSQIGVCKRYPPALDISWFLTHKGDATPSYLDERHWNQPVTESANWCGEFVHRDNKENHIATLKLTARDEAALLGAGIKTIDDLNKQTANQILMIPSIGRRSLQSIREALKARGERMLGDEQ